MLNEIPTNNTAGVYGVNAPGYKHRPKDPAKIFVPDKDGNWPAGVPGVPGESTYTRPEGWWDNDADWDNIVRPRISPRLIGEDGKSTEGLIADDGTVQTALPPNTRHFILGPLVDAFVPNHGYDGFLNIGYIQKDTRAFVLLARINGQWEANHHNASAPVWDGTSTGFTSYNGNFTLEHAQWFRQQIIDKRFTKNLPYNYSGGVPQQSPWPPAGGWPDWIPDWLEDLLDNMFGGSMPGAGTGGDANDADDEDGEPDEPGAFGDGGEPDIGDGPNNQGDSEQGDNEDAGGPWPDNPDAPSNRPDIPDTPKNKKRKKDEQTARDHGLSSDRAAEMSDSELRNFNNKMENLDKDIQKYADEKKALDKEARDIAIGFGVDVALTIFGGAIIKGAAAGIGAAVKGARALNKARQVAKVAKTLQAGSKLSKAAATTKATNIVNRANNIKKSAEASRKAAKAAELAKKSAQSAANKPGGIKSPYPKGYKGPQTKGPLTGRNVDGSRIKQVPKGQPGSSTSPYPKGYKGPQKTGPLTGKPIPKSTVPKSSPQSTSIKNGPLSKSQTPKKGPGNKFKESDLNIKGPDGNVIAKNIKNPKTGKFERINKPGKGASSSDIAKWERLENQVSNKAWQNYLKTGELKPSPIGNPLRAMNPFVKGGLSSGPTALAKKWGIPVGVGAAAGGVAIGNEVRKGIERFGNSGGFNKIEKMLSPKAVNINDPDLKSTVQEVEKELGKEAGEFVKNLVSKPAEELKSNMKKIRTDKRFIDPKRSDFPMGRSGAKQFATAQKFSEVASPTSSVLTAGKVYLNYLTGNLPKVIDNKYLGDKFVNRAFKDAYINDKGTITVGDAVIGSGGKMKFDSKTNEVVLPFNYDFDTNEQAIMKEPDKYDARKVIPAAGMVAAWIVGGKYGIDSVPIPGAGYATWLSKSLGIGAEHRPGEIRMSVEKFKANNKTLYNRLVLNGTIKESNLVKGLVLTESRSKILREIKKPVVVPELPKKYKMNFKGKFKAQNTPDVTASKQTSDGVKAQNAAGQAWREKDKDWARYESEERMNVVYDQVGHGEQAWDMIVAEAKKKNGWKNREIQEQLNIIAAEKAMRKIDPDYISPWSLVEQGDPNKDEIEIISKDPLVKRVAKRLKQEIDYPDKPSRKGYPDAPPKKQVDGWHPDYGKKYKYDKLDPVSADTMSNAPTGDPEIDSNVQKARKLKKKRDEVTESFNGNRTLKDFKKEKEVLTEMMTTGQVFSYQLGGSSDDLQTVQSGFDGESITAVTSFTDIALVNDPHDMGTNIRNNDDPNLVPTNMDANHTAYTTSSGLEGDSGGFRGINWSSTSTETNENQPVDTDIVTGSDGPYMSGQVGAHLSWGSPGNPGYPRFAALKAVDTTLFDSISINWFTRGLVVSDGEGGYVARDDTDFTEPGDGIYLFYWAGDKEGAKQYAGDLNASVKDHDGWRPLNVKPDGTTDSDYSPLLIPHKAEGYKGNRFFKNNLELPPWARDKNTRFIIVQIDNHTGIHKSRWGMTSVRFQRRNPMNVVASLDSPEATTFVRLGQGTEKTDPKKRKQRVQKILKASKQYVTKALGKDFPGMDVEIGEAAGTGNIQQQKWADTTQRFVETGTLEQQLDKFVGDVKPTLSWNKKLKRKGTVVNEDTFEQVKKLRSHWGYKDEK